MGKKLYVGNLSYEASDNDLRNLFEQYGTVESAQVIMDRDTGRSRGFGFVEMSSDDEAQAAIDGTNGQEAIGGRTLTVNEARSREGGGGRGGRGAGGGGFRGGHGGGDRGSYRS